MSVTTPVIDHRTGTPSEQLSADLERMRLAGVPWPRAWEVAFDRIKWPHDTAHRRQWKAVLLGQQDDYEESYYRERRRSRLGELRLN